MKNNVTKTILAALASATAFAAAGAHASANEITIQDGDTLSQIAANNNVTVDELVAKNNIANPDLIIAGNTISTDGIAGASASSDVQASADENVTASASDDTNTQATTNTNTQAQAATTSSVDYSTYSAGANGSVQTIINAMNAKRAAAGLAPVSYDASLAATAASRAANAEANGGLPTGHFQQVAGPEVVAIDWSPSAVVDAWYNETGMVAAPAHRNWLMNASFTKVGFAIVGDTIVGIAG
ncbi:CAP domain-containing protein [Fructobacillus parabroussonetiae]|uniref:LysM peptidoglycan-binding domain-containing protein n=1 Tax=Fructobacillus parabroussonetiae TaxID=2713174 RepID=A0ABS5QVZ5_9LACO|nr:CAP domain-containing protein [Fructobacillus parabroussonetiae]MBS9336962.1 LysM peptidoglycan-binding domain-containing protein [Fructobacillus parabroussonetiae]